MTSSRNDDVTILTSDSERALSITYREIKIYELLNTSLYIKGKNKSLQCVMTSSRNDDVTIMTSDS